MEVAIAARVENAIALIFGYRTPIFTACAKSDVIFDCAILARYRLSFASLVLVHSVDGTAENRCAKLLYGPYRIGGLTAVLKIHLQPKVCEVSKFARAVIPQVDGSFGIIRITWRGLVRVIVRICRLEHLPAYSHGANLVCRGIWLLENLVSPHVNHRVLRQIAAVAGTVCMT